MYCFVAGVDPAEGNIPERMNAFLTEVRQYEGLVEIRLPANRPNICVLCFESQEAADVARWMMEIGGAEPTKPTGTFDYQMKGAADGENDQGHTDNNNRQQDDGEGDRNEAGGG